MSEWFEEVKAEFITNFIDGERWRFLADGLLNTLQITVVACGECLNVIFAEATVFNGIGGVDVAGGADLAADLDVLARFDLCKDVVGRGDVAVFGNDDDLNSGAVAVGELDLLLTVGGNGKSRHAHVRLAGSNGGDDRIKRQRPSCCMSMSDASLL